MPAPVVKSCEIEDQELKEFILATAAKAVETHKVENEIAHYIKKTIEEHEDMKYGKLWHVIVGRSFGSYVTFEKNHYIYFYVGSLAVQVFKTP